MMADGDSTSLPHLHNPLLLIEIVSFLHALLERGLASADDQFTALRVALLFFDLVTPYS